MERHHRRAVTLALILLFLIPFAACNKKVTQAESEKHYDIEGVVVSVDKAKQEVTLNHKDIPGFMKGMTMPFKVKPTDVWVLNVAEPGDSVRAVLAVTDDDAMLKNISLTKKQASAPEPSTSNVHNPQVGEAVPDFVFTDQDGKRVRLSQLRGAPVLLTFIYTRCPLPDYCIRMSNNFGEIAKQLKQSSPNTWNRAHLLSISFDPEFDKPTVLKQYGKSYAGSIDPNFQQWKFVTASPVEVRKTAEYFGLSYEQQSGQIIHSLRTALIDKDGKLAEMYKGNNWTPSEVVEKIKGM